MKIFPLKLMPDNVNFDFIRIRKLSYFTSITLSLLTFFCIYFHGFNFGIDFVGGINIDAQMQTKPDISKIRKVLNEINIGEIVIQTYGENNEFSIRVGNTSSNMEKNIELIKSTINQNVSEEINYKKIDYVGPQVGQQLIEDGAKAIFFSFLAIMIYVWIRFEWQFGFGVLIALVHDAILSLGFMSITHLDFNLSTIAALLTIIGYSVNDSVVIFDRIRENFRKYRSKTNDEIINLSINETLSRTILTVVTTLIACLALIIFGGEAIFSFSIVVFFGIVAGTYSSIFISAPILNLFTLRKQTSK
jgi:preprotein translocase subunit SecF